MTTLISLRVSDFSGCAITSALCHISNVIFSQDGRGQTADYYPSPQSFIISYSFLLTKLSVIYKRGNFVYQHWNIHHFISNCLISLDP